MYISYIIPYLYCIYHILYHTYIVYIIYHTIPILYISYIILYIYCISFVYISTLHLIVFSYLALFQLDNIGVTTFHNYVMKYDVNNMYKVSNRDDEKIKWIAMIRKIIKDGKRERALICIMRML